MGNAGPKAPKIVSPENLDEVAENMWLLQSKFNFLNVAEIGLNGLVIKTKENGLVYINPAKFTEYNRGTLEAIEKKSGEKVKVIISPGDWHHNQLPDAQDMFPEAKMYVASERNLRKQKSIKATVVDRLNPVIPELGEDFVLIPWLGFTMDSMPWLLSGAKKGDHRIEFIIFHKPTATLFLTDHFLPPKEGQDPFAEPNNKGFKLVDLAATNQSIQQVLDLNATRVVFSHGPRGACIVDVNKDILQAAYDGLLSAHKADDLEICAGGSHLLQ